MVLTAKEKWGAKAEDRLNPFLIREVVLTALNVLGLCEMKGLNPFLIREVVLTIYPSTK